MALQEEQITYNIIGAAIEVHRVLGSGFLEGVYHEALQIELQMRQIDFVSQSEIAVTYKGKQLKTKYKPDFVIKEKVIVEIKALQCLSGVEEAQLLNYLKVTKMATGLLINFGAKSLEWKRMVL